MNSILLFWILMQLCLQFKSPPNEQILLIQMHYLKDKPSKLSNISPKSTRPTVSPSRLPPTRQQLMKPAPKRPPIFKVQHQSHPQPTTNKINLGRIQTLGDEIFNPLDDDYETPKFNAEKEFKFGNVDAKKEGDFFTFGIAARKHPVREVVKSKGKENTMLTSKEIIKGVNKIMKGSSPNNMKTSYAKKDNKESISPRKRFG